VDAPAAIVNGLDDADAVVVARAETSAKKASSVSAPPSSPTRRRFAAPRDADAGSALASSADGSLGSGRGARMGARSHIAIAVAMRRATREWRSTQSLGSRDFSPSGRLTHFFGMRI
jgi:hypothetical protein